jgi:hypothetical protein
MDKKESNADRGAKAVQQLRQLLERSYTPAIDAICGTVQKKHSVGIVREQIGKAHFAYGPTTCKVDLYVDYDGMVEPIAIAVISTKDGGSNQIERRKVDFYRIDQGLSDRLIYIIKLFTGTIKPSAKNRRDYAKDADLSKGYAYYRDLSAKNKAEFINQLRSVRHVMLDRALLGRGEDVRCNDKKMRQDRVDLIAFYDARKTGEAAWSFCDPDEVIRLILSSDVKPAANGARQVQLGYGITLKRYGGGLYKGDTSIKDYLQLQIQPRKVLDESTNWTNFVEVSRKVSFGIESESDSKQAAAAKRGLAAEQALIEKINQQDNACTWIVEECCNTSGYGNFSARKPSNKEKPDVVLEEKNSPDSKATGISLKTYKPEVSFGQANRGTVDTYSRDLDIPDGVVKTLRDFTTVSQDGQRVMLNQAPAEAQANLLKFFTQYQRPIVSHILRGKSEASLKADWMMFHEAADNSWTARIGNHAYWQLFPMARVIDCCCSLPPIINENGNLILGVGLTLQRKGGDKGAESANDLQFKINPKKIIEVIGGSVAAD